MKKIFFVLLTFFSIHLSCKQTTTEIMNQIDESHVEFVNVYFTDVSGNLHELIIPQQQVKSALLQGLKFDGSSIPGYSNIYESDMHLSLDSDSFFIHPSSKKEVKTARIFANVYQNENSPYPADPRYLLQESIEQAEKYGYEFYVGPELEFFLLEQDSNGQLSPWDNGCYFDTEQNQKHAAIKIEMMQTLLDHGIIIEKLHHEVAPGQHEFSIQYDTAIEIADQIMLAKHLVKQVARKHGLIATFMPKPFHGMNGSGMHVHFSVAELETGLNLFFDEDNDAFLSPFAHSFMAGILNRVHDASILLNSTVNSYKRLVPGYEAPVYICWAKKNRSALIRIPQINETQPYAARAEIRCPDALANSYFLFTFLLNAGLEGIKRGEEIAPATEEDLFKLTYEEVRAKNIDTLPISLQDAANAFYHSDKMSDILPFEMINEYFAIKDNEAKCFQRAVTNWEFNEYL